MKEAIEAKDIRKGDLIRYEYPETDITMRAVEYVAWRNRDGQNRSGGVTYFLLARPVPTVILPTDPGHYLPPFTNSEVFTLDTDGKWWCGTAPVTPGRVRHDGGVEMVKLEPVAETAKRVVERMASWWEFGPPANWQSELNDVAAEFGVTS